MSKDGSEQAIYGAVGVAKELGISLRQLNYWVDVLKAVRPAVRQHGSRAFRRFTASDLGRLKTVRRFVDQGYTLRAAIKRAQ